MERALKEHDIPPEFLKLSEKKSPHDFPSELVSPIHPISTPAATTLMYHLRRLGYSAMAIKYPVVPKGMDRLRICLHGGNTEKEMDQFIGVLIEWAKVTLMEPPIEASSSSWAAPPVLAKL